MYGSVCAIDKVYFIYGLRPTSPQPKSVETSKEQLQAVIILAFLELISRVSCPNSGQYLKQL